MRNHQESHEFGQDWVSAVTYSVTQVLDKGLEHLSQNLQFNFVDSSQDFNANSFVDWEQLLNSRAVVSNQNSGSLLELVLSEVSGCELHEIAVQVVRALLLGEVETLVPSA